MKKLMAVLVTCLLAQSVWAGNASYCVMVSHPNNISGNALRNNCSNPVEATWCFGTNCKFNSSATIHPGQEFPLSGSSGQYIRYDACNGANSIKDWTDYGTVDCR